MYSVYSGVKYVGTDEIEDFSRPQAVVTDKELSLSGTTISINADDGSGIQTAGMGTNFLHSYVTFPGVAMHPIMVTDHDYGGTQPNLTVAGRGTYKDGAGDVLSRDVIRPYHDILLVRAGLAYVDNKGTFCFYDINDKNDSFGFGNPLPTAAAADAAGELVYRVEGIKAVRFVEVKSGDVTLSVNVHVLAEGDNAVTGRTSDSVAVQELRNRVFPPGSPLAGTPIWPDIDWKDEIYYEDFEMSWRTRNIESPTP
jgi:hypothetical protein